jgi:acyl-CoA reductase-like NAD-dependent aldehyde dehydrogenase
VYHKGDWPGVLLESPEVDRERLAARSAQNGDPVRGYVEIGQQEGAELLTGGTEPDDPALAKGNFLTPAALPRTITTLSNQPRLVKPNLDGAGR